MQEHVYHTDIQSVDELQQHLIQFWCNPDEGLSIRPLANSVKASSICLCKGLSFWARHMNSLTVDHIWLVLYNTLHWTTWPATGRSALQDLRSCVVDVKPTVFFDLLHPHSAGSSSSAFPLRSVVGFMTGSSVHG